MRALAINEPHSSAAMTDANANADARASARPHAEDGGGGGGGNGASVGVGRSGGRSADGLSVVGSSGSTAPRSPILWSQAVSWKAVVPLVATGFAHFYTITNIFRYEQRTHMALYLCSHVNFDSTPKFSKPRS